MRIVWTGITLLIALPLAFSQQEIPKTTRVEDPKQHERKGPDSYPYREWSDYIMDELDIRTGDKVLDVGSGDGWWINKMLDHSGEYATYYALEVEEDKVEKLQETFDGQKNVKPFLAPKVGTGLDESSIDLVFFSQVYHHLPDDSHVDYLKHLKDVVKPTGRVCIIEKYSEIATRNPGHSTRLSTLIQQAEEAGWILLRYQLIPNTYHYLTIFAQKELFPPKPKEDKKVGVLHTKDPVGKIKSNLKSGKAILLDVREQNEWDEGYIAQAKRFAMSKLQTIQDDEKVMKDVKAILDKDKIIYPHCAKGGRALRAGKVLSELGYDVRPLPLGFNELADEGFETVK